MPDRDFSPDGSDGSRFDDLKSFFTEGEPCENCGKPCDAGTRIWIPGWNYFGCDDCAEESRLMIFAEENCESLYVAILRAKCISEVRAAFCEHKQTCPNCNPKISKMEPGREIPKERAA